MCGAMGIGKIRTVVVSSNKEVLTACAFPQNDFSLKQASEGAPFWCDIKIFCPLLSLRIITTIWSTNSNAEFQPHEPPLWPRFFTSVRTYVFDGLHTGARTGVCASTYGFTYGRTYARRRCLFNATYCRYLALYCNDIFLALHTLQFSPANLLLR